MNGHVLQGVVSVLCMYNMRVMCVVGWNGDVGSLFMVNMISCTTFRGNEKEGMGIMVEGERGEEKDLGGEEEKEMYRIWFVHASTCT